MISIENVSKSFSGGGNGKGGKKTPALKNITAKIATGVITGLVGPDGAGKTTLLRLLCGLMTPSVGSISVLGFDPTAESDAVHSMIGYMPQRFGLYEDLSVMENLKLHADLRNVPQKERKTRYEELLSFTNLTPFTKRLAGRLSGGMKQKLGLACTLLARPPVLLLDEPSVGVDPVARRELWRIVKQLLTSERLVLWSTAYLDEAEDCDSVLLLNEGELLYDGPPGELSARLEGRTFLIEGAGEKRRALIVPVMLKNNTIDAVIQGSRVRVVTRDDGQELRESLNGLQGLNSLVEGVSLSCHPTGPRFEDAFMDALGGARPGNPAVAEFFRPKGNWEKIVEARRLTRKFGEFTAVDDVSFSIYRGEIFGLLGPNGAGKSTTFKMLCGLLLPTSGACSIAGIDFRVAPGEARSHLGYMAQKFSLYGELSVRRNLDFFSGVYGLSGAKKKDTVKRVIETFDLARYLEAPAQSLPLGYKQRLAMGCAIMHGPDVLFLDEPTSGVDPVTRREFWTYINEAALRGVTVMVTTHFMDEAEYCDRVALIYNGKVAATGTPDELKAEIADADRPDPTLEDTFIHLIEHKQRADGELSID